MKFDTSTIDNLQGLHSYMNTLMGSNDDLQRFQIRKVSFYWGYHENNYVYYMLCPPWIRLIVVSRRSHSTLLPRLFFCYNSDHVSRLLQNDTTNQLATRQTNNRIQASIRGEPIGHSASKRPHLYSKEIVID